MPKILISELFQIMFYLVYAVIASVTQFEPMLYFAFGAVIATAIPSVLLGFGFKGMKPAMSVGNSAYEKVRGLPVASAVWGMLHVVLAFFIFIRIRHDYLLGLNIETLIVFLGFICMYFMASLSQSITRRD